MGTRQKIYVIDVNAQTESVLNGYLAQGYVLHQIVFLQSVNKLLIVYYDPASEPD